MSQHSRKLRLTLVNLMDDLHKRYPSYLISEPPLSVGVLYSLTPKEIEAGILDEQTDRLEFKGDVFAFSVTTQMAKKTYLHADELRKQGKIVILGGYHVTVCPQESAKHADCIVTGEAETVWPEVCKDLLDGRLKHRYAGSPTPEDEMTIIDRAAFHGKRYAFPGSLYATRGCVHKCSFCASSRIFGRYRRRPLENLEQEIDAIRQRHGDVILQFTDDTLLADKEWTIKFLGLMRRKKAVFVCQITADHLCDRALMEELSRSGCIAVGVGVESLDEDNLRSVDKKQNLHRSVAEAVEHARSIGMHVVALLIFGLAKDTPEGIDRAIQRLRAIPFAFYNVCILRPFPGTALYSEMLKAKETRPEWWLEEERMKSNLILPGYLRVYFDHQNMDGLTLQKKTLEVIERCNSVSIRDLLGILTTGWRAGRSCFALKLALGRAGVSYQARRWKSKITS